MIDGWRSITVFLPAAMPRDQVVESLRSSVMRFAADGGEFVHGIRVDGGTTRTDGWREWRTSFRTGPPGLLPCPEGSDVCSAATSPH